MENSRGLNDVLYMWVTQFSESETFALKSQNAAFIRVEVSPLVLQTRFKAASKILAFDCGFSTSRIQTRGISARPSLTARSRVSPC